MKKTIIIPYYGKFPQFFQLFLNSCGKNNNYNWLIFTNCTDYYTFPSNVEKIYLSFESLKKLIQSKFDYEISLNSPYKLCDYKVAYGKIFSAWLENSEWWGYSDCDLIYGNFDNILTKSIYLDNDKIFTEGHFALFRNNEKINNVFEKKYDGVEYAKKVFTSNKIFGFDEMVINDIFEDNNFRIFTPDFSANVSVYYYNFRLVKRIQSLRRYLIEDYVPAIYYWSGDGLYRMFYNYDDGRYIKNEFLYIHLQQRNLNIISKDKEMSEYFQFLPNQIRLLKDEPKKSNFNKIYSKGKFSKTKVSCFIRLIKYKVKKELSILFKGKFTRGNY